MRAMRNRLAVLALLAALAVPAVGAPAVVHPIREGFVDTNGVLLYYKEIGQGDPLVVLHGGPGASHDYLLPGLLPLARANRLIFVDERGSGRSERLEDVKAYTVEQMVEDVEGLRQALGLGRVNLLGHSYGGVVAQAYALSTRALNEVFRKMKARMPAELRGRIDRMEAAGLYGRGKAFEQNRYSSDYMTAAWGEGYFPYLYQRNPDPNYDPVANGVMSWDLYREMWGSHGEFVVDGNLVSVEYTDRLATLKVPTLITVGDHDQTDPALAEAMHAQIAGSKLVVLPHSGHMTFVDQPRLFGEAVDGFLHPPTK